MILVGAAVPPLEPRTGALPAAPAYTEPARIARARRGRQALSAFKRRGGPHERTIRDLRLGASGIESDRNCASCAAC
jgi:hypothetical protein